MFSYITGFMLLAILHLAHVGTFLRGALLAQIPLADVVTVPAIVLLALLSLAYVLADDGTVLVRE